MASLKLSPGEPAKWEAHVSDPSQTIVPTFSDNAMDWSKPIGSPSVDQTFGG